MDIILPFHPDPTAFYRAETLRKRLGMHEEELMALFFKAWEHYIQGDYIATLDFIGGLMSERLSRVEMSYEQFTSETRALMDVMGTLFKTVERTLGSELAHLDLGQEFPAFVFKRILGRDIVIEVKESPCNLPTEAV